MGACARRTAPLERGGLADRAGATQVYLACHPFSQRLEHVTSRRLFADRRAGRDRRVESRRLAIGHLSLERRRVVDRRRGWERRSTLDRRAQPTRAQSVETPGEHIRNALQLLHQLAASHELGGSVGLGAEDSNVLSAAIHRARRALELLERRRSGLP